MIDLLIKNIKIKGNPIVCGLDPKLEYLPDFLLKKHLSEEVTLKQAANSIYEFNKTIIDNIYDLIPAVKLQLAYYELYGLEGIKVFLKTQEYARNKGLIVIGDGKRNDIGSTALAYAKAYLGKTEVLEKEFKAFPVDFLTVNPYLGIDGIDPFLDMCQSYDKGIFVLVKTSNPSSGEFQDLTIDDGHKVYEKVAEKVKEWGKGLEGSYGYSKVGAVIGATYPEELKKLRLLMPNTYFLIPGYGAQGGTIEDILPGFNEDGLGAIINSSRAIMCAYRDENWKDLYSEKEFGDASRAEVLRMIKSIQEGLK